MKAYIFLTIITLAISCNVVENDSKNEPTYLRWVGDITYDPLKDSPEFNICNGEENVVQYFHSGMGPVYKGEKLHVLRTYKNKYKPVSDKNQNGLIRIRFIVNCEGRAGRFRVLQSDLNFVETKFNNKIISQLLEITKDIDEWVILQKDNKPVDYYYYLIFKIIDGQITEILP